MTLTLTRRLIADRGLVLCGMIAACGLSLTVAAALVSLGMVLIASRDSVKAVELSVPLSTSSLQSVLIGCAHAPDVVSSRTSVGIGWCRTDTDLAPFVPCDILFARSVQLEVGWPMRCFVGSCLHVESMSAPPHTQFSWAQPLQSWAPSRSFEIIPMMPMSFPLLANTCFFTILFACSFLTLHRWRWRRRHSRGLCPYCAYEMSQPTPSANIGGLVRRCPECSTPYPPVWPSLT
jgi:hypothetical protein